MTNPNPNNPFSAGFAPSSTTWQTADANPLFASVQPPGQPQPDIPIVSVAPYTPVWVPRHAWEYFSDPPQQSLFVAHRQQNQATLQTQGKPYTEAEELKLVDRLWRNWYDEPWPGMFVADALPDLDPSKLKERAMRKFNLKPFKLNYQTFQEIKLRLNNTVIAINGNPFHVKRLVQNKNDFIVVLDDGSELYKINYKDIPDLRSIPPMYIKHGNRTGWLCRLPSRVYQQGLNRHNTVLYEPDCERFAATMEVRQTLIGIRSREDRKWTESIASLFTGGELTTLRLSDDVAIKKDKEKIVCCYRGRPLGEVKENVVTVEDNDDLLQGWIESATFAAGLELR